jgi:uncharacterized protein YidB (DUF937 family)
LQQVRRHNNQEIAVGLFDGILGGVVGAEMVTVVSGLIERHGGVGGIVSQLQQQGLGATVKSWVSTGANQPVSAPQLGQALGMDAINQYAARLGMNPQDLLQKLTQALRQAIDHLTSGGVVPKAL